jgi:CRP-like cAMP-binding protein
MGEPTNSDHHPLLRRLDSVASLSEEERDAIQALPMQVLEVGPHQDVVREGDRPNRCCLILEGLACVYKVTHRGRRQIHAFQHPGDIPDLLSLHLDSLDSSVGTITRCKVAFIWHKDLRALCRQHPGIAEILWRTTLIDASIFKEWITNVGQRDAYSRLAHLFCETFVRLRAIGQAEGHSCEFPITQEDLAAAAGITAVHANRTLKELRANGLVDFGRSTLTITDFDRLQKVGEFDPGYLHLRDPGKMAA